jgi:hypothetical protein
VSISIKALRKTGAFTVEKTMNKQRLRIRCLSACVVAAMYGYPSTATAAPPDFTVVLAARG